MIKSSIPSVFATYLFAIRLKCCVDQLKSPGIAEAKFDSPKDSSEDYLRLTVLLVKFLLNMVKDVMNGIYHQFGFIQMD